MGNEQKSLLSESEWRKEALRWFLSHGVEANLAEDLTQEVLQRLLRCQKRQQAITRAYLHCTCQSVLCDHKRRCKQEPLLLSLDDCCSYAVLETRCALSADSNSLTASSGGLRWQERVVIRLEVVP
jgi:DNA-directed RNA polymerase specialized sigma24 family protein